MEPYPDAKLAGVVTSRVYLARDGALPRPVNGLSFTPTSLSSEGWSPTPTHIRLKDTRSESI